MSHRTKDLSCYVACFNEVSHICKTLDNLVRALQANHLNYEIIVIDDASTDNSVQCIEKWMSENPAIEIRLVKRGKNVGLALNFVRALNISSGKYFRLVCGDDVEPFEALNTIFSKIGEKDMIIPYHTKCPGKTFPRKAVSWLYTNLVNISAGNRIKYYNGLTVAKREDFVKYCRPKLGFSFQADFICQSLAIGRTYIEVGVETIERRHGVSTAFSRQNMIGAIHLFRRIIKKRIIQFK
jgi:glycosyltransferase involved in cell wall biosynthesis